MSCKLTCTIGYTAEATAKAMPSSDQLALLCNSDGTRQAHDYDYDYELLLLLLLLLQLLLRP